MTATSEPVTTVATALLALIRDHGVDTVFGIPGTHNVELYRPLQDLGFRVVTTRHEQGAAFAADGWALTSGHPGVVLTTSGPGLLNALSAAATCWAESRPLLLLSPGAPRGSTTARVGALHETKDVVGASGSVLTWSRRVETAAQAVAAVRDAFALFRHARPGPVHIEVPMDLLAEQWHAELPHAVDSPPASLPPGDELARAVALLRGARRPVVLAGGGAIPAGAVVQELAERLAAPVITTLNGKGVVDEQHPLVLGSDVRLPLLQDVLNGADVLLVIGSDIGEAELWEGEISGAGAIIRVDLDAQQAHTTVTPTVALIGDSAVVLPALVAGLPTAPAAGPWIDIPALCAAVRAHVHTTQPVLARIVEDIVAALPPHAIIGGDSSQVTYLATSTLFRSARPRQLLYMPTYATLGYGLPAALGAKIAAPDSPVIALVGDGALMFSIQEFVTAVEQGLCLPVVCVDNGGYGEIRQNMVDAGVAPTGVDLAQPDWPALAHALGGVGFSADPTSVGAAVRDALRLDTPSIIHVRI